MPMRRTINSPGVEINETDNSFINEKTGTSALVVGFAAKGPVYEPLVVTSIKEFEDIFGLPTNASERYFYHTVRSMLNSPASITVVRIPYTVPNPGEDDKYSVLAYPMLPLATTELYEVAASPSPSVTPTLTPTITITPTYTPSVTITPTYTPSVTITLTPTITPTKSPPNTPSITPTYTPSLTPTITPTATITPTYTPSNTITPTVTITPTYTPSVTPTVTPTYTPSVTITPTVTPTVTPTYTPSVTITPTYTPSITPTYTPSLTPTPSPSTVNLYKNEGDTWGGTTQIWGSA